MEKEIEKILDKKQSNQNIDLEKEINRVITKRRAKDDIENTEKSIADAKKKLSDYKEKLKQYKENPEYIKKQELKLKKMQEETEQYEKRYKSDKANAIKRLEEVKKDISLRDYRVKEGAFAFFEWAGNEYPIHKKDAENAISILDEYQKKGDVKKTLDDATSYNNLITSFDLFSELEQLGLKNDMWHSYTNLSILAKAMVSANRNVYSSNSITNTFNITEYLYSGDKNPIEYWYNDGKVVYDELKAIINDKYVNENERDVMEKAREEYKRIHGKEADLGRFGEFLNRDGDVIAIARNSSKNGSNNNTYCLNADNYKNYGKVIADYDGIFDRYKRITDEYSLLEDKEGAENWIKRVESDKKEREKKMEDLKNHEDNETFFMNSDIRDAEKEIARLEKEYKEKKEAYDKLK